MCIYSPQFWYFLVDLFQNENFEIILEKLPKKDFSDILQRAKKLDLTRSNVCSTKRSIYDLMYELTEQTYFKNALKKQ